MHRALWPLKVKRLPVAAGVVAAFGSLWLTCKDQFYLTNSYSNFLWNYFVPGFLKSNGETLPNNPPFKDSQPSRKLPNIEIRKSEKLIPIGVGVVSHFETNVLASNEPVEDRNSEYIVNDGILFGVFDGHSGWQCAEEVMKRLPYYVALSMACSQPPKPKGNIEKLYSNVKNLQPTADEDTNMNKDPYGVSAKEFYKSSKLDPPEDISVEKQLTNAYWLLDQDIVNEAIPGFDGYAVELLKGLSGACAITAYVHGNELYVANSGDCRSVLGSKGADGKWHATALSIDQNAGNIEEIKRLHLEHPGERFVVSNDRLLGVLQPLRAFGDVMFKWDYRLHEEVLNRLFKRVLIPVQLYPTPPYLTAEPVVTRHTLKTGDQFLVIASDGLWDMMSNERAVQCIGEIIDSAGMTISDRKIGDGQVNGASELIQEALGGNDEIKVSTLLEAPKHIRRALRDDITVTVVYFTQQIN